MSKRVPKWAAGASWAAEWDGSFCRVQARERRGVIEDRMSDGYGGWMRWKEWKGMTRRMLVKNAETSWGEKVGFRVVKGRPINLVVKGGGK